MLMAHIDALQAIGASEDSFANLATSVSDCSSSAKGGDLGTFGEHCTPVRLQRQLRS
jgi:parvulin-like peptidyl-prolyl isomerase